MQGCFVTGTDTEVGKTRVAAALVHLLGADGQRSAGFKPVAAGLDDHGNEDVRLLRAAANIATTDAEVGPCQLRTACAPQHAAAIDGVSIDRSALRQAALALGARCDRLVVEGVGGFCVPLGDTWDSADLACDLALPVLLVVGLRLGCINHALLTAQAVQARGLRLAGWIGNTVGPGMLRPQDTIATLQAWLHRRHGAPCLGLVPWLADPTPAAVASHLDAAAVRRALCLKGLP